MTSHESLQILSDLKSGISAVTHGSVLLTLHSIRQHKNKLKNKKDCADVYCVRLIELQAHRDAFIQNNY
jgi:hypothetical protein